MRLCLAVVVFAATLSAQSYSDDNGRVGGLGLQDVASPSKEDAKHRKHGEDEIEARDHPFNRCNVISPRQSPEILNH